MKPVASQFRRAWLTEGARLASLLVLAAGFGLVIGHLTLCLLIAVAAYLAAQLVFAYQLHRWLAAERIEPWLEVGVWQDIYTELSRLKQRNRRRKKQLRNMVAEFQASTAALPDGAVVLDRLGRIMWFNSAAAALLALRSPADRGQRIVNLLRYPKFSKFLARADQGEMEMPSPANEDDTILVQIVPYGNAQRLLIARDVSEQKRLEATRRDFVANASHELRTPLTVLRGYLEIMAEETGPGRELAGWHKPVAEMSAQSQRMGRIIDSLLRLARVEAEGLHLRQETVDVPAMLEQIVEELKRTVSARQRFELDVDADLLLFGRSSEIESVFSNLLANAIRYTPSDSCIRVRWQHDEHGANFAVHDDGPGIAPEHVPRLTERFYRVDKARRSGDGGTGLGLAIVKHCLEHHESTLTVDSVPGQGSAFICQFPSQRVLARESDQPAQTAVGQNGNARPRVVSIAGRSRGRSQ